jgi:hypothetical protein
MKWANVSWSQLLVLGGSTVVSWLAGTTQSPKLPHADNSASGRGVVHEVTAPVRLQNWRGLPVGAVRPERDVFAFKGPIHTPPTTAAHTETAGVPPVQPPVETTLRLIGMAQEEGDDASAATAIVADHGQVYLVKAGDVVPPGYTVNRVVADSVELTDPQTGVTLRLFMK